ncbi:MAG: ATP-dependent chaperone ClpB, partial [Actinomycetales bacterium]
AKVASIQVEQLRRRLADRRIELQVSDDAMSWLVNRGFDPIYGARPLRRLVQTAIGDPLAKAILAGAVRDGGTVEVGVAEGGELLHLTSR